MNDHDFQSENLLINANNQMEAIQTVLDYFDHADGRESDRRSIYKIEVRWLHADIP